MGLRYDEATDHVLDLLKEVRASEFPELVNAKIKVLFDLKKRKSGGLVVLARIMKTNDLMRHLTKDGIDMHNGYDYIVTLDKKCWENITDLDRIKILRHELRHTFFDIESEDNPYKLLNHSVSDFYEEVELNKNDPRWRERVATLTEDIYEQEKEARTEKKRKKN
ncbi:MAG: putative metallopeptidase [Syntrophorhabdaceae bacterium]